jgi:hypothetical protein
MLLTDLPSGPSELTSTRSFLEFSDHKVGMWDLETVLVSGNNSSEEKSVVIKAFSGALELYESVIFTAHALSSVTMAHSGFYPSDKGDIQLRFCQALI